MDRRGRDMSRQSAAGQPQGQRTPGNVPAPRPPQHVAARGHSQQQSCHGSSTHGTTQIPIKQGDVDLLMHFAQHSSDSLGRAAMPDKSLRPKPMSAFGSSTQAKPTFLVPSASPLAKPSAKQRSQSPSKRSQSPSKRSQSPSKGRADINNYLLRTCRYCHKGMSVPEMAKHEGICQASKARRKPGHD